MQSAPHCCPKLTKSVVPRQIFVKVLNIKSAQLQRCSYKRTDGQDEPNRSFTRVREPPTTQTAMLIRVTPVDPAAQDADQVCLNKLCDPF